MSSQILFAIFAAYLIGSIPFGYLMAKIWNIDIRHFGSGNIGATNVLRTLGPIPGAIVFILDILKGTLAVYLAYQVTNNPWLIVGIGATVIIGHTFPIFLKFKGGRGAAAGLGVLLGIAPDLFLGAVFAAMLILLLTRYVSLTSMLISILVAVAFFVLKRPLPYTLVSGLIAILIIFRHIPNIKRLMNKTEPKIGDKK